MHLTAKYFFDGVAAKYAGSLTFRGIEKRGEILKQPGLEEDITRSADQLVEGLTGRRKVLFACRENACRSQMAAAFARLYAGDRLDVACAGSSPSPQVNPMMVESMQALGIDMAFRATQSIADAIGQQAPDEIITMGCAERCPVVPGARQQEWDLPDPAGQSMQVMDQVRDRIDAQVKQYVSQL
jgi:arsenate reductase